MADDPAQGQGEIVIVRRRGGDDGAVTKGGAWKIAYADFVTAMMAFFLVMWLINASNEETRAQVASYFNPIKLTDNSTGARGLRDKKESRGESGTEGVTVEGTVPSPGDTRKHAELMANPVHAIENVEKTLKDKPAVEVSTTIVATRPDPAPPGIGDPFDPKPWEKGPKTDTEDKTAKPVPPPPPEPPPAVAPELKALTEAPAEAKDTKAETKPPPETREPPPAPKTAGIDSRTKEAAEISAEIAKRMGTGLDMLPASIDVRVTGDGILISLTDREFFGMFKLGSADPQPDMVQLVETIAKVLADRDGYIVVRGHTDSRPYRRKTYDNWQLSTARAHLAQYMLVRGGLDEKRIRRVEGVADREPRNPADPQAPENRRIEILLGLEKK